MTSVAPVPRTSDTAPGEVTPDGLRPGRRGLARAGGAGLCCCLVVRGLHQGSRRAVVAPRRTGRVDLGAGLADEVGAGTSPGTACASTTAALSTWALRAAWRPMAWA